MWPLEAKGNGMVKMEGENVSERLRAAGLKVKRLEWEENVASRCSLCVAISIVGIYRVEQTQGRFAWTIDDEWVDLRGKNEPDMEAAKAAAQADYESRLLSALEVHALMILT